MFGYSPWMLWFAWRPVQLRTGGWAWLKYIRCRCFIHEPIWGGAPDNFWEYTLINNKDLD